ncbi:MAG: alpha/beta fold hydrolase [Planctomycetes bacterium]|nr:alpha/beta fold hydrolase [Planctomycetota bacterium]
MRIRIGFLILLPALAAGCGNDYFANQLVAPDAAMGRLHLMAFPSDEEMVRKGTISGFRNIAVGDGVNLNVWLVNPVGPDEAGQSQTAPAGAKGAVVVLHGWLDSKARYLPVARQLSGLGYQVVLVDFRAHGRSSGKYIGWGAIERKDVKAVMDRLLAEGAIRTPFYAYGTSMGASIAIMYAADDERCKAVCAVEPPRDIQGVARQLWQWMPQKQLDEVVARAGQIAGFEPADASAIIAAARLGKPLLLVHGTADTVVPIRHSREICQAAAGPKKLIEIPFADHASTPWGREPWLAKQMDEMIAKGL